MTENKKNPVLIVGTVAYDTIETPRSKADFILGGSASYAALACSFFAPSKIVSIVGKDFKDDDVRRLTARNIDISGVEFNQELPTFFWHGKYHENFKSRETLDVRLNAFENYNPTLSPALAECEYVLLGNISPELQNHALTQVKRPKFVILDTMDLWISIANEPLRALIKKADLLILNDDEAKLLTGDTNLICAAEILRQMGAGSVIIKKGEHGSMLFHDDGLFSMTAYPIKSLFDPTGAGDSFAGALAGCIAANDDCSFEGIKRAMLAASATASITVESFSCDKLEESGIEEIKKRMDYIKKISTI